MLNLDKVYEVMRSGGTAVIFGPRQSGKTTLLEGILSKNVDGKPHIFTRAGQLTDMIKSGNFKWKGSLFIIDATFPDEGRYGLELGEKGVFSVIHLRTELSMAEHLSIQVHDIPVIDLASPPHPKVVGTARVCHEVNKAYCAALGDDSQKEWVDAPEWQRKSAVKGVLFHMENPEAGPEASHNSWMAEKVDAGWVYGDLKSEELKTHPCIVPFGELPPAQQAKDYIFRQIVHSLLHK